MCYYWLAMKSYLCLFCSFFLFLFLKKLNYLLKCSVSDEIFYYFCYQFSGRTLSLVSFSINWLSTGKSRSRSQQTTSCLAVAPTKCIKISWMLMQLTEAGCVQLLIVVFYFVFYLQCEPVHVYIIICYDQYIMNYLPTPFLKKYIPEFLKTICVPCRFFPQRLMLASRVYLFPLHIKNIPTYYLFIYLFIWLLSHLSCMIHNFNLSRNQKNVVLFQAVAFYQCHPMTSHNLAS